MRKLIPQNAAYATSNISTWREISAIKGSGEQRSIHEEVIPTTWLIASFGVKCVSAGARGGTVMALVLKEVPRVPTASKDGGSTDDRWDESKDKTREWKCEVVIGVVSMSYWICQLDLTILSIRFQWELTLLAWANCIARVFKGSWRLDSCWPIQNEWTMSSLSGTVSMMPVLLFPNLGSHREIKNTQSMTCSVLLYRKEGAGFRRNK